VFNFWKKKNVVKEEKVKSLVWNDEEIKLDTNAVNNDYEFINFTGHILLYDKECFVENASFIYHVGNINYFKRTVPLRYYDKQINRICVFSGVIKSGFLRCDCLENATLNGGCVFCKRADGNIINNGEIHCINWLKGTVNGGHIYCDEWRCGTFNNGIFESDEWKNGIFNNGIFKGKWYGGKWKNGTFNGRAFVGDGTFESIEKI
jgi:hypothetical protein